MLQVGGYTGHVKYWGTDTYSMPRLLTYLFCDEPREIYSATNLEKFEYKLVAGLSTANILKYVDFVNELVVSVSGAMEVGGD